MPEAVAAPVSVSAALGSAARRLAEAGCETPRLDAELLLGEVLRADRARLVLDAARSLDPAAVREFDALVERRAAREPVAYILGRRAFRWIELDVDGRVLIPRPETELLVEAALELPSGAWVLDVGTGSGAVALALASERPDLHVVASDVDPGALDVARANAARLGLEVDFVLADLIPHDHVEAPDAILANLPYVADRTELPLEVARYEPAGALFGGVDGLDLIRRLVSELPDRVSFVALEVGEGQAGEVGSLLDGFDQVERLRDLAGIDRVVVARR